MSKAKPEKPAGPVVLSAAVIADGKLYAAGSETPFTEKTLPAHLREYIATGQEAAPFDPAERNIYEHLRPELRRQAREVLGNVMGQETAEDMAVAEQALPPETEEALRVAAERHSALGKAQLQFAQDAIDTLHESLAAESEPQRFYVKRGAVYTSSEKVKLRPSENVYVQRPDKEWECVGIVDCERQLPDKEITP